MMGPWLTNGQDLVAGSGNPYKIRLRQNFFPHSFLVCLIITKFCIEHGSIAAMLYAKFYND